MSFLKCYVYNRWGRSSCLKLSSETNIFVYIIFGTEDALVEKQSTQTTSQVAWSPSFVDEQFVYQGIQQGSNISVINGISCIFLRIEHTYSLLLCMQQVCSTITTTQACHKSRKRNSFSKRFLPCPWTCTLNGFYWMGQNA